MIRVAHDGAAQWDQIVQRVGRVLRNVQNMQLRQIDQHLRRRLRVESKLAYKLHSIDRAGLHRLLNGIVWWDDRSGSRRSARLVLAFAVVDAALFSKRQRRSKLILAAPCTKAYRRNGVCGDGFHEPRWRNDLGFSGSGVR